MRAAIGGFFTERPFRGVSPASIQPIPPERGRSLAVAGWLLRKSLVMAMSTGQPAFVEGATSTEDLATRAAQMWLSNPLNKFSLPTVNAAVDADGDGLLDKDEFAGLFDLDGDGVVDANERAKARALFATVDKDGDGQLTKEELKQVCVYRLN